MGRNYANTANKELADCFDVACRHRRSVCAVFGKYGHKVFRETRCLGKDVGLWRHTEIAT